MSGPEDKPPEKELSIWKQFIEDLSWDVPFLRAFGNLSLRLFVAEGKAVRHGWFAFVVLMGLSIWITHSRTESGIDAKLSGITNNFNGQISDLKGQLHDAKEERDKFQLMLSPFEALAIAKYTNAPFDKRFDLLTEMLNSTLSTMTNELIGISSITNTLTASASKTPAFELYIDESTNPIPPVTGMAVHVPQNRKIELLVRNTGQIKAKNVVIQFIAPMNASNVTYSGWTLGGSEIDSSTFQIIPEATSWFVDIGDVPAGYFASTIPPLIISTNMPPSNFSADELQKLNWKFDWRQIPFGLIKTLPTIIDVSADISDTYKYFVFFQF